MLFANFKLKKYVYYLLEYLFCFLAGIMLLYIHTLHLNSKEQKIEYFTTLLIFPIILAVTSLAILILLIL